MKRKRFTANQIVKILKEADAGVPVTDLCRKYGVKGIEWFRAVLIFDRDKAASTTASASTIQRMNR